MAIKSITAASQILTAAALLTCIFASGIGAGLYFYPQLFPAADAVEEEGHGHDAHSHQTSDVHDDHGDHEAEEVVALSEQAYANLKLELGTVVRRDYLKTLLVPGRIVEIPGRSDLSVSAPVGGIIQRVLVVPGQSIVPNQPLLELQLTDESLIDAQSQLLATLTAEDVAQQEIQRLAPLTEEGLVGGGRKRELEYEVRQLKAKQEALVQELLGRGMPESMIETILKQKQLATNLMVRSPSFVNYENSEEATGFSIEELHVHPGKAVLRGDDLCGIAYHSNLYVEGTAFEDDLTTLNRIAENQWDIAVEAHLGATSQGHDHAARHQLLQIKLLRIDNHIDDDSQTVRFFGHVPNTLTRTKVEEDRRFDQWRFRPGQRLHLRLPVESWKNQIVLPSDAVVIDGPNVFVFAEHDHRHHSHDAHDHDNDGHDNAEHDEHDHDNDEHGSHEHNAHEHTDQETSAHDHQQDAEHAHPPQHDETEHASDPSDEKELDTEALADQLIAKLASHDHGHDHDHGHGHNDVFVELEPVPVHLLYRDDRSVVIADDGQIRPGMRIAMNAAKKLYLALQMQANGGGGHGHSH